MKMLLTLVSATLVIVGALGCGESANKTLCARVITASATLSSKIQVCSGSDAGNVSTAPDQATCEQHTTKCTAADITTANAVVDCWNSATICSSSLPYYSDDAGYIACQAPLKANDGGLTLTDGCTPFMKQ